MAKSTQAPVFVAVDGGSGNVAIRYNDENGKPVTSISPSLVRRGLLQQGTKESSSTWRTADGEVYSVTNDGTSIELENTCDPNYQIAAANRVLVMDALVKAGLGGRDVVIADTLPADQFYGDNGINKTRIDAKKASLLQPVSSYSGDVEPPNVLNAIIYPEAVTAFVSASVLPDGSDNPVFEGVNRCIIVDLGRFTCDIAIVSGELDILNRVTTEHGIHTMIKRLHHLLQEHQEELNLSEAKEISLSALDGFIERGYVGSQAKAREHLRRDIRPLVEQAARELADQIRNDVRQLHRNLLELDMLLFVGGGANWLGGKLGYLPDFSKEWHDFTYIPDEPQFSVVRGVHMLMMSDKESIQKELEAEA
ncbi:ParM/StbA family protein [Pantoea sp. CCBC3-3-1]|uniref:ParM/StbA family protein n=1 Tax=Pantoea sp. CCBC3-3-1 TaxID=2490851 RepID=UPI0011BE534F|nr:ParM/StbA family protein [Pantoea sp. CCBC3-3-1]